MLRLEIKVPKQINNCKGSYERKSTPILDTWRWKEVAIGNSKTALEQYALIIPIDNFYLHKRIFRVN